LCSLVSSAQGLVNCSVLFLVLWLLHFLMDSLRPIPNKMLICPWGRIWVRILRKRTTKVSLFMEKRSPNHMFKSTWKTNRVISSSLSIMACKRPDRQQFSLYQTQKNIATCGWWCAQAEIGATTQFHRANYPHFTQRNRAPEESKFHNWNAKLASAGWSWQLGSKKNREWNQTVTHGGILQISAGSNCHLEQQPIMMQNCLEMLEDKLQNPWSPTSLAQVLAQNCNCTSIAYIKALALPWCAHTRACTHTQICTHS
jgi:hypothetical protein